MQLLSLQKGLKPLTLAAGMAVVGSATFMYADADQFTKIDTVISNHITSRYIQDIDNIIDNAILEKSRFYELYNSWLVNSMFMSSVSSIIDLPDFKAIVSMGLSAVPFILDELRVQPSNLVWALNLIFKKKITNRDVTISEACKLWIKELS